MQLFVVKESVIGFLCYVIYLFVYFVSLLFCVFNLSLLMTFQISI